MTEEQAKTKWCPQRGRVGMRALSPGSCCIASACMAWRLLSKGGDVMDAYVQHLTKPKGEVNPPFSNTPEGYRVTSHDSWGGYTCRRDVVVGHEPATGYCGLSGPPQ